tara:strand:- start:9577 stop:10806 length:1230 start_codon:yes stop_codon:yes gene_type:complete
MLKSRDKNSLNQAVIFCGGFGTRLGSLTQKTPKPLIKVYENKSILDIIIYNLERFGIKKIFLLCHYKFHLFKNMYHKKIFKNCEIECVYEKKLLGSAGSLYKIKNRLEKKFLVCNGDTFFDFNLLDLFFSFKKSNLGIISVASVKDKSSRYSKIKLTKDKINSFDYNQDKNTLINSGIYILRKKIFKYFKKSKSLEKEVFNLIIKKNKLQGKIYDSSYNLFIDIGVKKDLFRSQSFFKKIYKKKAVFLDRDGIINIDKGYTFKSKDFYWRKKIKKLIKYLNDKNYFIFVITNQSGVGRGYYKENDVRSLHKWVNSKLSRNGAHIDDFQFATYYKYSKIKKYRQKKNLRKPMIGMFKILNKEWNILKNKSLVVGDKDTDIKFANNAGLKSIKIDPKDDIFEKVKKKLKKL